MDLPKKKHPSNYQLPTVIVESRIDSVNPRMNLMSFKFQQILKSQKSKVKTIPNRRLSSRHLPTVIRQLLILNRQYEHEGALI